jgi:hypothetical protein
LQLEFSSLKQQHISACSQFSQKIGRRYGFRNISGYPPLRAAPRGASRYIPTPYSLPFSACSIESLHHIQSGWRNNQSSRGLKVTNAPRLTPRHSPCSIIQLSNQHTIGMSRTCRGVRRGVSRDRDAHAKRLTQGQW